MHVSRNLHVAGSGLMCGTQGTQDFNITSKIHVRLRLQQLHVANILVTYKLYVVTIIILLVLVIGYIIVPVC